MSARITPNSNRRVIARQKSHSFDDADGLSDEGDNNQCEDVVRKDDSVKKDTIRKPFRKEGSRDDINVAPSANTSFGASSDATSSLRLSYRTNKDDSYSERFSKGVVSGAQNSFVRVYVGLKTFLPRNKTVVIAIYIQAAALIYEVVIIDVLDEKEVCRFYVSQGEIVFQLRKRKVAQKQSKFAPLPPTNEEGTTELGEKIISRKTTASTGNGNKPINKTRRRTDGESTLSEVRKWQNNQEGALKLDFDDDIDLDTVDVNTFTTTKLPSNFFPRIILKSLKSNRIAGMQYRYRLVNDMTKGNFTTFNTVPDEIKSALPTFVDAKALIAQAKSLSGIHEATSSLKASVTTADTYALTTNTDFKGTVTESKQFAHENTRNPNVFKWRFTWQKAIETAIAENRFAKNIRKNWGQLIDQFSTSRRIRDQERQRYVENRSGKSDGSSSGFRKFRSRRIGVQADTDNSLLDVNEMAKLRQEMASKRKPQRGAK